MYYIDSAHINVCNVEFYQCKRSYQNETSRALLVRYGPTQYFLILLIIKAARYIFYTQSRAHKNSMFPPSLFLSLSVNGKARLSNVFCVPAAAAAEKPATKPYQSRKTN